MKIDARVPGTKFDEADDAVAEVIRRRALARAETVRAMAPKLRQRAVAVAGVEDAKALEAVREACAKVPEGKDWREARREVAEAVGDRSATRRRAELVLRTNCETARAQARWREMKRDADIMPYLMYQTMQDEGVRPSHRALDGKIFRIDDDFWKTHYPPWDWGCRCTVVQMDAAAAKEMCDGGVGQMASEEFMEDFRARFGNERHTFEFDREGGTDWTDERAMGISEDERRIMHDVLSDPAHTVVNEQGERENAWEYLWRTGPQAQDEATLRSMDRTVEHVVVRDAETGAVLETASGTATGVKTKTEWYDDSLEGRVRTTHIHQGEFEPLPSPDDVLTALGRRSECETVISRRRKATLRPPDAEKEGERRAEWTAILKSFARADKAGKLSRKAWKKWLVANCGVFGFETEGAK